MAQALRGRCHCGPVASSRLSVALRRALPLRELPARALRGVRHLGRLSVGAGASHAGADELAAHESSPGTFRRFCRKCGTKLFFESGKWPGETHVVLAAFDDPVDRAPSGHAFYEEHVAWLPPLRTHPE